MSDEQKHMTDHEYDGIRELDNPLPDWWLITFFATIIFSFIYYIHYEVGGIGMTQKQELQASLESTKNHQQKDQVENLHTEESLGQFDFDSNAAQSTYQAKCAVCHNPDGGGSIGPNLTDHHWLNGQGTRIDILATIANGIPAKGMPAWRGQITENELLNLTLYIYNMKDKPSPNGKPPQGIEYKN